MMRNDFEECRGASSIPTTITIIGYHYGILFINIIGKFGRPLSFDEPMFLILTPDTHTKKKCCLKCDQFDGQAYPQGRVPVLCFCGGVPEGSLPQHLICQVADQ